MKGLPHRLCALFLLAIFALAVSGVKSQPQEFQISADKLAAFAGQYQFDDDPDRHLVGYRGRLAAVRGIASRPALRVRPAIRRHFLVGKRSLQR